MDYPPLLQDKTPAEYRTFFEATYCHGPVITFDGIAVRFRKRDFNHCFFESVIEKDDTFSPERAKRLLWIKTALQDPDADLYVGWDNKKKCLAHDRRVAIVVQNYVVIIRFTGPKAAVFVTAFVAGEESLRKIRMSPRCA